MKQRIGIYLAIALIAIGMAIFIALVIGMSAIDNTKSEELIGFSMAMGALLWHSGFCVMTGFDYLSGKWHESRKQVQANAG